MARGMKNGAVKTISKTDAVKEALAQLGRKAKPGTIREFVKNQFGIEISVSHVSNIKSTLKRGKKKRRRRELNGRHVEATPSTTPVAHPRNGKKVAGIDLDDVEATKELTRRLGAPMLHALIDVLAN